ncbi:adenylyl-sulfate kinase [Burkholderia ubonensis]|uniref:adenylyl-sulfate kinase n=1 Tax=Burkholderia ubonensis TaxID=101571 RepID=UPI001E2EFB74|nr:adenylyl-sulfate kinase [Burkholderia ubonensis]
MSPVLRAGRDVFHANCDHRFLKWGAAGRFDAACIVGTSRRHANIRCTRRHISPTRNAGLSRRRSLHACARGLPVCILDGGELRAGVSPDLGFKREDRAEHCRRTAEIAKLLNSQGITAIVALVSPYEADRQHARHIIGKERFVEIHLKTDIATCSARDPKRLHAKAITGQTRQFTGISDPYEPPEHPDLVIDTGQTDVASSVESVMLFDQQRFAQV